MAVGPFPLLALLAACASPPPLDPAELTGPMRGIHAAFAEEVRRAREEDETVWKSGWFGNLAVHLTDDRTLGLCYEWQGRVYPGIAEAAERHGWTATGIEINGGSIAEHHAVLVYDARALPPEAVLRAPRDAPAYVLDPWKRGEPDVWRLADWLALPAIVFTDARLEPPWVLPTPD